MYSVFCESLIIFQKLFKIFALIQRHLPIIILVEQVLNFCLDPEHLTTTLSYPIDTVPLLCFFNQAYLKFILALTAAGFLPPPRVYCLLFLPPALIYRSCEVVLLFSPLVVDTLPELVPII